jgi:hypothetical protein
MMEISDCLEEDMATSSRIEPTAATVTPLVGIQAGAVTPLVGIQAGENARENKRNPAHTAFHGWSIAIAFRIVKPMVADSSQHIQYHRFSIRSKVSMNEGRS